MRQWYEKYIGYCFNDNGTEVILKDVFNYEDGRRGYELHEPKTGRWYITDYSVFKKIAKQNDLPMTK